VERKTRLEKNDDETENHRKRTDPPQSATKEGKTLEDYHCFSPNSSTKTTTSSSSPPRNCLSVGERKPTK